MFFPIGAQRDGILHLVVKYFQTFDSQGCHQRSRQILNVAGIADEYLLQAAPRILEIASTLHFRMKLRAVEIEFAQVPGNGCNQLRRLSPEKNRALATWP